MYIDTLDTDIYMIVVNTIYNIPRNFFLRGKAKWLVPSSGGVVCRCYSIYNTKKTRSSPFARLVMFGCQTMTYFKSRALTVNGIGIDRDAHLDSDMSTPVGFEPTRAEPIGLAGRRLSRSAKVSVFVHSISDTTLFFNECSLRGHAQISPCAKRAAFQAA